MLLLEGSFLLELLSGIYDTIFGNLKLTSFFFVLLFVIGDSTGSWFSDKVHAR